MTDFYTATGAPSTGSSALSATIRTEFSSIASAFAKLADYTGNADKLVVVNSAATAYTTTSSLVVGSGGTGATSLTDGGILLGSGTGAVTPMAVLADGEIVVGDGVTDPVPLAAFTSSTGTLKHESGGIEADISAIADGGLLIGTATGTISIRASAFTAGAAGFLKHEAGGLEFDASGVVDGDFIVGTGTGTFGIESGLTAKNSLGVIEHGQCRLDYASTTQIKLSPYNGNKIVINGSIFEIPSAGVTLANTGLTAAKEYDIYVYDSSGTLTLEAVDHSVTNHATDTTAGNIGVEIKASDATRTLVGKAYMDSGSPGTFANSSQKRFVISWFNRKQLDLSSSTNGDSTASTSGVELNTAHRLEFATWGTGHHVMTGGSISNNTVGQAAYLSVLVDGTVSTYTSGGHSVSAGAQLPANVEWSGSLSEGYRYVTTGGQATAGTMTIGSGEIRASIQG